MYLQNNALDFENIETEIIGKDIVIKIFQSNINQSQVQYMESCSIQLGVEYGLGILLFALNFEEKDVWYDTVYSYDYSKWLIENEGGTFVEPEIDSLGQGEALSIKIHYIDSSNNLIKNVRTHYLSQQIRQKIITSLEEQKKLIVPFINSKESGMKLDLFIHNKEFIESIPIKEIINNINIEVLG